eukprot:1144553-Pelagomonas_calceolata.AAC.2
MQRVSYAAHGVFLRSWPTLAMIHGQRSPCVLMRLQHAAPHDSPPSAPFMTFLSLQQLPFEMAMTTVDTNLAWHLSRTFRTLVCVRCCQKTQRVRCCQKTQRVRCCQETQRVRCCQETQRVRCCQKTQRVRCCQEAQRVRCCQETRHDRNPRGMFCPRVCRTLIVGSVANTCADYMMFTHDETVRMRPCPLWKALPPHPESTRTRD